MPEPRLCCGSCFGDRFLHKHIAALSTRTGDCSYCGRRSVPLVDPTLLADKFELLISVYQQDDNGKFLVEWFKEDWKLFHAALDIAQRKELLERIPITRNRSLEP
jgi:hypothetical protein